MSRVHYGDNVGLTPYADRTVSIVAAANPSGSDSGYYLLLSDGGIADAGAGARYFGEVHGASWNNY